MENVHNCSLEGGGKVGQNWVKFVPCSCLMPTSTITVVFVNITVGCLGFFLIIVTQDRSDTQNMERTYTDLLSPLRNSIASALEKTPSSQTLQVAYSYLW